MRAKFGTARENVYPPPEFGQFSYVKYAHYVCDLVDRNVPVPNLSYPEGEAMQQFIIETFCPYRDEDADNNYLG